MLRRERHKVFRSCVQNSPTGCICGAERNWLGVHATPCHAPQNLRHALGRMPWCRSETASQPILSSTQIIFERESLAAIPTRTRSLRFFLIFLRSATFGHKSWRQAWLQQAAIPRPSRLAAADDLSQPSNAPWAAPRTCPAREPGVRNMPSATNRPSHPVCTDKKPKATWAGGPRKPSRRCWQIIWGAAQKKMGKNGCCGSSNKQHANVWTVQIKLELSIKSSRCAAHGKHGLPQPKSRPRTNTLEPSGESCSDVVGRVRENATWQPTKTVPRCHHPGSAAHRCANNLRVGSSYAAAYWSCCKTRGVTGRTLPHNPVWRNTCVRKTKGVRLRLA